MTGSFEPDSIILDIDLPDLNGMDVLKFIDKHERYQDIKVILDSVQPENDPRFIEAKMFSIYGNLWKTQNRRKILDVLKGLPVQICGMEFALLHKLAIGNGKNVVFSDRELK